MTKGYQQKSLLSLSCSLLTSFCLFSSVVMMLDGVVEDGVETFELVEVNDKAYSVCHMAVSLTSFVPAQLSFTSRNKSVNLN